MSFGYEVVRLWTVPAEDLLRGSAGTLPLAVLGALPEGVDLAEGLAAVAERIWRRIKDEAPGQAARLRVSAFELMGLRVKRNEARAILMGIPVVRESEGILAIMDAGREIQLKKLILKFGGRRLGQEDEQARAKLESITDLEHLERIHDRLVEGVPSWRDLLDTP